MIKKNKEKMETSKLTVGTTWNKCLIEKIAKLNKEIGQANRIVVGEVYGSIPGDLLGTARSKDRLHDCSYEKLEEHVKICHDHGIQVTYANNSLCVGSLGSLDEKFDYFLDHMGNLEKRGIDSVIFAFPFFIEQTKKYFPDIKPYVSTIADVNSVKMVDYYKELGADTIILSVDVNRNFDLLNVLINRYGEENFELLMTDACIFKCPYRQNHFASQSHDSVEEKSLFDHEEIKNYPLDRCWNQLTKNWPTEFLKSRWIRPEDLSYYEKIGFNKFKISGRTLGEEWILRSVKAYLSREWNGNLLEIFPIIPGDYKFEGEPTLNLDNKRLDGFIEYFIKKGDECYINCGSICSYCDEYANKLRELK